MDVFQGPERSHRETLDITKGEGVSAAEILRWKTATKRIGSTREGGTIDINTDPYTDTVSKFLSGEST